MTLYEREEKMDIDKKTAKRNIPNLREPENKQYIINLFSSVTISHGKPLIVVAKTNAPDGKYLIENIKETVCTSIIRIESGTCIVRKGLLEVLLYNLQFGDFQVTTDIKLAKITKEHSIVASLTPINYNHT